VSVVAAASGERDAQRDYREGGASRIAVGNDTPPMSGYDALRPPARLRSYATPMMDMGLLMGIVMVAMMGGAAWVFVRKLVRRALKRERNGEAPDA
jgi:hypothetical protein